MKSRVAFFIIFWMVIHKGITKSISNLSAASSETTLLPTTTIPITKSPPATTITTTAPPHTTTSNLCFIHGSYYPRNSTIAEQYVPSLNMCKRVYVNENCKLIESDRLNCRSTTAPPTTPSTTTPPTTRPTTTTTPPTTTPTTTTTQPIPTRITTPNLCEINEKYVYDAYDAKTNYCYGAWLDENCYVVHYDNWNCYPKAVASHSTTPPSTTTTQTTTPQTTTTQTPPVPPCVYNGHRLNLYESYTSGCEGAYCSDYGLVKWDHCGCYYDYQYHKPGTSIVTDSRGCAGIICTTSYSFEQWDNCPSTTTTQTFITPLDTTPSITTTPPNKLTDSPNKIKKKQVKEIMKKKMMKKLRKLTDMKKDQKITKREFLKMKRWIKKLIKKKMSKQITKMETWKKKIMKNKEKKYVN